MAERLIDRALLQRPAPATTLRTLACQLRAVVDVLDRDALLRQALHEAQRAFDATGGAVYLQHGAHVHPVYVAGTWHDVEGLAAGLQSGGTRYGWMVLGPRRTGRDYLPEERALFEETAALTARAMRVAAGVSGDPDALPDAARWGSSAGRR